MEFLEWLETSALALFVQESLWAYPIILSGHAVGMAILVGIALMVNLRLLGIAQAVPLAPLQTMVKLGLWGFAINFISGLMLFAADASFFFGSWPFRIKFVLLVVGGYSLWLVYKQLGIAASGNEGSPAKVVPTVAVVAWVGVIVSGRLIAYIG